MYPLAKKLTIAGLIFGAAAIPLFHSLLAGLAFFVLFFCVGLLWRGDEVPILPFALAFQWIFIVSGYLYTSIGGDLKEYTLIGNVDLAVLLSLIGLVCIAIGIRLGIAAVRYRKHEERPFNIDTKALFGVTIVVYSVSWLIELSPMQSSSLIVFNAAQVLSAILSFREVLLCLLWLVILQRRGGYHYGWIAFIVALVPRFSSRQSTFKELIFMLLIVACVEFKPWIKTAAQRSWNRRLAIGFAIASIVLLIAGVIWEGAIKPVWRNYDFEGSPIETLDAFAQVTAQTTSEMDEAKSVQAFVNRISSITQFALVLDRVPATVPFEDGLLTKQALNHILVPRILFPNKEVLESDSRLAERYAGLTIGEDTSVGIGYMAEFYVDFGISGMFPSLFLLGVFFGIVYRVIFLVAPNFSVANAVVIVPFIGNFITYEATLAKLLGGFIMSAAILLVLSRSIPFVLPHTPKRSGSIAPTRGRENVWRPAAR